MILEISDFHTRLDPQQGDFFWQWVKKNYKMSEKFVSWKVRYIFEETLYQACC